jgi:hypothetical protein
MSANSSSAARQTEHEFGPGPAPWEIQSGWKGPGFSENFFNQTSLGVPYDPDSWSLPSLSSFEPPNAETLAGLGAPRREMLADGSEGQVLRPAFSENFKGPSFMNLMTTTYPEIFSPGNTNPTYSFAKIPGLSGTFTHTTTTAVTSEHAQQELPSAPGIFGVPLGTSIKYANVAISLIGEDGQSFIYGYVPIVVAKCGVYLKEKGELSYLELECCRKIRIDADRTKQPTSKGSFVSAVPRSASTRCKAPSIPQTDMEKDLTGKATMFTTLPTF